MTSHPIRWTHRELQWIQAPRFMAVPNPRSARPASAIEKSRIRHRRATACEAPRRAHSYRAHPLQSRQDSTRHHDPFFFAGYCRRARNRRIVRLIIFPLLPRLPRCRIVSTRTSQSADIGISINDHPAEILGWRYPTTPYADFFSVNTVRPSSIRRVDVLFSSLRRTRLIAIAHFRILFISALDGDYYHSSNKTNGINLSAPSINSIRHASITK